MMQKKFFVIIGVCATILVSYFGYVLADSQETVMSFNPFVSQDTKRLAHINNEFSLDFYLQLANNTDDNIFFSPTSMLTAFAILYEGADNNTAAQMQDVFGFEPDNLTRRDAFVKMQEFLNPQDGQYKLRLANGLWLAHDFEPLPEYVDTAKTYYDSKVESLDFSRGGADTINDWVSEKTEGKIDELFGELPPSTKMVIANAIYFKGTWMQQFDPERTKDRSFYLTKDESIQVPMMHLPRIDPLPHMRNEQMAMLEMPYEGDDISMLILLPHAVDGLKSLEDTLTAKKLEQWKGELLEEIRIAVELPKFTLETDYNLKGYLSEMGMPDAFSGSSADFGKITDSGGLFVGQAIHKAYVDVNEEGTEAAAATGIAMLQSGFTFYADHPFLFIIQEKNTGQILFMGRVVNPQS